MQHQVVSIALCTYNGEAYIRKQLDTLIGQTYPNIEIIIVDDCSTDQTVQIISQYAAKFEQIKLTVNKNNLGYIKNFEKAVGLCRGNYIALCDQDDIWDMNKISIMINNIGDHMLIYHDSAFIDEQDNLLSKKISDVRNCYSGADSRIFIFENCVSGHAMLFKKDLLKYVPYFSEHVVHDWWLAYAAANNGSILFLNQVLVQYRQHLNANTNILKQERDGATKDNSLQKIAKQFQIEALFANYEFNKDKEFKQKLNNLLEERMTSYTSFSLAYFVFKHRAVLLYIRKKSGLSKLTFCLKMIWGYKWKALSNAA